MADTAVVAEQATIPSALFDVIRYEMAETDIVLSHKMADMGVMVNQAMMWI